jgi:hypothetical protein
MPMQCLVGELVQWFIDKPMGTVAVGSAAPVIRDSKLGFLKHTKYWGYIIFSAQNI